MVTRMINGIELDVDPHEANALYFDESFAKDLLSDGIEDIQKSIYSVKNTYLPISVLWELTNRCNYQCPFCYINYPGAVPRAYILKDKWKPMIDGLISEGMLFCTLTGGECLLHPEFIEIYSYLKKAGTIITIFTNGALFSESHFKLFHILPPYKIEISLYSLNGNSCCPKDAATTAMKNALRLKHMGIQVVCKTPINQITEPEYNSIKKYCIDQEIPYYSSVELLPTYDGRMLDDYSASPKRVSDEEENGFKNMATVTKNTWGHKKRFDCSGGKYTAFVSFDYDLYPCISAYGIERYRISLTNKTIHACIAEMRRIIESEQMKRIEGCSGCNYNDVCDRCVLSKYLPDGVLGHSCSEIISNINKQIKKR